MADSIKVFAPASSANLTCGFDVLGLCLENPGDEVVVRKSDKPGIVISSIEGDGGRLSYDPAQNTVSVPILEFLKKYKEGHVVDFGFEIDLIKKMPFGSGLGSSAASSVAGVFAVNELLEKPMHVRDLLPFAMEGERQACGSAHADNVAPSLLGGIVMIRSYDPVDVISLNVPPGLFMTVVHPHVEVSTSEARKVIPKQIPLEVAVEQTGNLAGLITGFMKPDYQLISRSMTDVIIEPKRAPLIPLYDEIRKISLGHGALGFGISGSGPSMFAMSQNYHTSRRIGEDMIKELSRNNYDCSIYHSEINEKGPQILD